MLEDKETILGKHLSAEELLRNKGICHKAWNDWDESSRALPKIGASKQFEPSGSWLEKKQIEKGLNSREFLLGIERVERTSQLASAEWLPEQKRARVTKKVGNEWANFGQEINANLYLIPEEALILLETECLELVWEGVPLSIQQAYEVLIESEGSTCTLAEYRVYSQLTRLGYRLQRFHYEKSLLERYAGLDESAPRKKVIVDPENGHWMAGQNAKPGESSAQRRPEIDAEIKEIVESMVVKINGNADAEETRNGSATTTTMTTTTAENNGGDKSTERKAKNPKLEIISEQTILSPIKIVKDGIAEHNVSKWPGARIQRNVKLLPKRNDRLSMPGASSAENSGAAAKYEVERTLDKRKHPRASADSPETKKSKHEIIELSDDEIEEIPRPMSRMEMLNCLPNVANQLFVTEPISKRYIPRGVVPRAAYRYDGRKLRESRGSDRTPRAVVEAPRSPRDARWTNQRRDVVPYYQHQNPIYSGRQSYPAANYSRHGPFSQSVGRWPMGLLNIQAGGLWAMNSGIGNSGVLGWPQNANNRWSSYRMNFLRNAVITGYALRGMLMQHQLQMQSHQSFRQRELANQTFHNRPDGRYPPEGPWRESCPARAPTESGRSLPGPARDHRDNEPNQATFAKLSGTSSWTELKQKWRDAKTITIDGEDSVTYDEDANEIQVIDQTIKPLINATNFRSFPEAYERLRIIKSAPEKTVRRRRSDLKISYNVYSSTQHYRKANPGMPMFHLAVTSRKDSVFLQPVELNRLQQDGKGAPIIFAHVSNSSIAYEQSGIIALPNLI